MGESRPEIATRSEKPTLVWARRHARAGILAFATVYLVFLVLVFLSRSASNRYRRVMPEVWGVELEVCPPDGVADGPEFDRSEDCRRICATVAGYVYSPEVGRLIRAQVGEERYPMEGAEGWGGGDMIKVSPWNENRRMRITWGHTFDDGDVPVLNAIADHLADAPKPLVKIRHRAEYRRGSVREQADAMIWFVPLIPILLLFLVMKTSDRPQGSPKEDILFS